MIDNLQTLFGMRLRELRKQNKMTQEELAFKAGIDVSYLGFIERGQQSPTLRKIEALAKALKVEPSELFYFHNDKGFTKSFTHTKNKLLNQVKAKDTKLYEILSTILNELQKAYLQ